MKTPAITITKATSKQANSGILKLIYYGVYKIIMFCGNMVVEPRLDPCKLNTYLCCITGCTSGTAYIKDYHWICS
jgi:hypothetical protein